MKENIYKKGFYGVIFNYVGMIGSALFKFLLLIILVRFLTVSDYGIYNLLMSMASVALFLSSFGIGPIWERYIPEYLEKKNYYVLKRIVKSGIIIEFAAGIFIIVVLTIFSNSISFFLNSPMLFQFLPIIGFIILLFLQTKTFEYMLDALLEQKYKSFLNLLAFGIYFILSYFLLKFGYGLIGVLWAFLLINTIIFLGSLKKAYVLILSKKPVGKKIKIFENVKKYGRNMYISGLGNIILNISIDNFLISIFLGSYFVGIYSFAYLVTEGLFVFSPAVLAAPVILPIIIRKYTKKRDKFYLNYSFNVYNKIVAFFSIPIAVGTLLLVDKLIIIVFNPTYMQSIDVLIFYIVAFMLWTFSWPISTVVRSLERSDLVLKSRIFIIYNLVMDIILIPIFGIMGAAIATGTSIISIMFYQLFKIKRKAKLSYPWKSFSKISLNVAIMALIVLLLRDFIVEKYMLIFVVVLGIFIYFTMSMINRIFKEDKKLIEQMTKLKIIGRF